MRAENCQKRDNGGDNFAMSPTSTKATLVFPNVANLNRARGLAIDCAGERVGRIDVYTTGGNRQHLGGFELAETTGTTVEIPLLSMPHGTGIEMVMTGCAESLRIDRFSFVRH